MPITITAEQYAAFGGTLEARVAAHQAALADHAQTVGVPRPVEDWIVDAIAAAGGISEMIIVAEEALPPAPGMTLDQAKAVATEVVNRAAEAARLTFITAGSGQAMVYLSKEAEARAWVAAGSPAQPQAGQYPMLEAEVAAATAAGDGDTLADAAAAVISAAEAWRLIGASIEQHRRMRVRRIAKADTVAEAEAEAVWTWAPPGG